jgi:hypothetical protein
MADDEAQKPMELVGVGDVPATFADVFLVVREEDTGISDVYFLQSFLSTTGTQEGTTRGTAAATKKARCVARIKLSEKGLGVLLDALAENRGLSLVSKTEEKK